ncbi:MAG: NAD(P)H-hydrate dehydratase [Mariprofundaceae bacterium]
MNHGAPIMTAAQMRWADRQTIKDGMPGSALMERAGQAAADAALRCAPDSGRVVIVAGPGNNGGDGYAAARFLTRRNVSVTVVALVEPESLQGDAAEHVALAQQAGVKIRVAAESEDGKMLSDWLARAAIVMDAILGIGLTRPLQGWMSEAVERINMSNRPVLAIDIASGIDSDSGEVLGQAVRATWTLPVAAYKWGHRLHMGREYAGELLSPAYIGIADTVIAQAQEKEKSAARSARIIGKADIGTAFPARSRNAHKKDFGHVWIFGGSTGYTGAPRLAALGAFACGAGLVSIACPDNVYPMIAASSLEVMVHPQDTAPWTDADAVVAGPGWGGKQQDMLSTLLGAAMPLLLDADILNMISNDKTLQKKLAYREGMTVITPHPGEAGRLLGKASGDIQADRLAAVLTLAEQFHAWVVLKGADTLIASPQGNVWLCPFGSAKLAVAGTGDVLAGMIGGLLAQGREPEVAVPAAVALHGLAGEQEGWHLAGQLADRVNNIIESEMENLCLISA